MFLNNFFWRFPATVWALILACVLAAAVVPAAHAKPLPLVSDLAQVAKQAREQRVPILIAFTLKDCPYCATARRNHWEPMHAAEKWRNQVVMVELVLDGPAALTDFDGSAITARDFARRFGVRSVPTVIVFNADGKPAHTPLAGLSSGDFYSLYLEQAVEAGLMLMRFPR